MKLSNIKINLPNSNIDERVYNYLSNNGRNIELAKGIQSEKRYWIGPLLLPLNLLKRCCGPEDDMEFTISEDHYNMKIQRVIDYINSGNSMEPIICHFNCNNLSIRDGNHRSEAFKKIGINIYWVIIWTNSTDEYHECIDFISNSLN